MSFDRTSTDEKASTTEAASNADPQCCLGTDDGESTLSEKETETNTIVGSVHSCTSSICKSKKHEATPPPAEVAPNDKRHVRVINLEKLRFRVGYALQCIPSRYAPSISNGHRPASISRRVEGNWWILGEDKNWTHIDADIPEEGDAVKECAKLLECIRFGNRATRKRALDAVGHLVIKYRDQLQQLFVRAGALGIIRDILSKEIKKKKQSIKPYSSKSDTLVFRCRRTLTALRYADGCELFGLHMCVSNMEEGSVEARNAARTIVKHLHDPQCSFIATRLVTGIIYNKPVLMVHQVLGFFNILLQLLDDVPSLHDSQGMDDLYSWALKNYDRLVDESLGWPYAAQSLESTDMVSLKSLIRAICCKKSTRALKKAMPNTHRIATILQAKLYNPVDIVCAGDGQKKRQSGLAYALRCVNNSSTDSDDRKPQALSLRIENNWWKVDENGDYSYINSDGDVAAEDCAKLLDCIRNGNRATREQALDVVGNLAAKYYDKLRPAFLRAGAVDLIEDILLGETKKTATLSAKSRLSTSDTIVFRCRRTLSALDSITVPNTLLRLQACVGNMGDAEAQNALHVVIEYLLQHPQVSFVATRLVTGIVYHESAVLVNGFFTVLLRLLDHIPELHDPQGMEDLYWWTLRTYQRSASEGRYTNQSLESTVMDSVKSLVLAISGEKHSPTLKEIMPMTCDMASTLKSTLCA